MPYGSWVNELPTGFFLVVHIAAFAIGAGFAWVAFKRELSVLASGFTFYAIAELVYMTYHLDWTVFLFAHTIAEVLDLAAFVLAGCSGAAESGEPVAATEVEMVKSYRFAPHAIEVAAGDTVTWTNEDNFTHTVQVDGQEDHKVEQGESVEITFDEPGTYHYVCTLHRQDMDGEVIVK